MKYTLSTLIIFSILYSVTCVAAPSDKFLPGLSRPINLNLALPEDFKVYELSKNKLGVATGVLWGRLEHFPKKTSNPEGPVISVRLSTSIRQVSKDKFSIELTDSLESKFIEEGFRDVKIIKNNWGSYPVLAISALNKEGIIFRKAFLGLNSGFVVEMQFFLPTNISNNPQLDQIWSTLISESMAIDGTNETFYGFPLREIKWEQSGKWRTFDKHTLNDLEDQFFLVLKETASSLKFNIDFTKSDNGTMKVIAPNATVSIKIGTNIEEGVLFFGSSIHQTGADLINKTSNNYNKMLFEELYKRLKKAGITATYDSEVVIL